MADKNAESPVSVSMPMYVPRDESLGELKRSTVNLGKMKGIVRNVIPSLITTVSDYSVFEQFSDIRDLYKERSPEKMSRKGTTKFPLTNVLDTFQESVEEFLKFDPPKINSSKQQTFHVGCSNLHISTLLIQRLFQEMCHAA